MKSAKSHELSRFSLVALIMLVLSVSFAFAKKPVKEPTYSWNVYVPEYIDRDGDIIPNGLQGGATPTAYFNEIGQEAWFYDGELSTTRNFVNGGYSNFEILIDPETGSGSEIGFGELDLECSEGYECGYMFSVIQEPIPQDPYVRIWFGFPSFSGYQYDEQPYEEEVEVSLAGGYFNIDKNYMGEPKYYPHPDVISGDFVGDIEDITVTRKSENVWHIQVDIDVDGIVNLEHQIAVWTEECNKRGKNCIPVLDSFTVTEEGIANSMKFDLYFVRVAE